MPQITAIGWFHTVVGAFCIIAGITALFRHKRLSSTHSAGLLYIAGTAITALTALAIYQHGSFGVAHWLAVLTLLALLVGFVAEKTGLLAAAGRYIAATSYLATLLFHSIPAVTDATLRLPVGDPLLTSIEDPRLKMAYLVLLVAFIIGAILQVRWLSRHPEAG